MRVAARKHHDIARCQANGRQVEVASSDDAAFNVPAHPLGRFDALGIAG